MLSPEAEAAVRLSAWAAKRWNWGMLGVPGLPAAEAVAALSEDAPLATKRAHAIATILASEGVTAAPAPMGRGSFALQPAVQR